MAGLQCLLLIRIQLPLFVCRSRLGGDLAFISCVSITYQYYTSPIKELEGGCRTESVAVPPPAEGAKRWDVSWRVPLQSLRG